MGLYGDKKDYEELVKDNINKARILSNIPKEYYEEVLSLLAKKDEIKNKNGLLASYQLKKIDNKIKKIQSNIKN